MNELKERLAGLGLTPEQIDNALRIIAEYVKGKLPPDYSGAVDSLLAGEMPDLSQLGGDLLGKMKGFFD